MYQVAGLHFDFEPGYVAYDGKEEWMGSHFFIEENGWRQRFRARQFHFLT